MNDLFPDDQELSTAKVLVIDDEESDINVIEWIFQAAKFPNIRTVTDSKEAVEVFRRFRPDLVLLDLFMPEPDGFTILKALRQEEPAGDFLPVLVLTGYDNAETRIKAMAAGANDFLGKPVDFTEVMLRVKNLLQTRFLHQRARALQAQIKARSTAKGGR